MIGSMPISAVPVSAPMFFYGYDEPLTAHPQTCITFGGTVSLKHLLKMTIDTATTITFDGSPELTVAGRAVVFRAVPERWTFRGVHD